MSAALISSAARTRLSETREEGEAGRQGVGGLDAQDARGVLAGQQQVVGGVLVVGHPDAGEVGQYAHAAEPVVVLRMADEHRRPCRRPQHPRLADAPAYERVHQRGLPRSGGSPDDGQQRRAGVSQPRHQVVVQLGEQFVAVGTRAGGPGEGQREACGGDTVAQGGECVEQLRPYVQGHHMRRMPNFRVILKHMSTSARRQDTSGWKGRLRRVHSRGITSAQHPMRQRPKRVHDSYLPAIIRTASPNLHIEPRRRGDRDKDAGALSLSPANVTDRPPPGHHDDRPPHPAPVAQWIEQAPSKRLAAGSSPAGGATRHQPERPRGDLPSRAFRGCDGNADGNGPVTR
jgi:hypothetical protein